MVATTTNNNNNPAATTTTVEDDETWVFVTGGKYQGKTLRFVKETAKRVAVIRPEDGRSIYLLPEHVSRTGRRTTMEGTMQQQAEESRPSDILEHRVAAESSQHQSEPPRPPHQPQQQPSPRWVTIVGGKHRGKTVRFVKQTPKRCCVEIEDGKAIYLLPSHVDMGTTTTTTTTTSPPTVAVRNTSLRPELNLIPTTRLTQVPSESQTSPVAVVVSDNEQEDDDDDFATAAMEEDIDSIATTDDYDDGFLFVDLSIPSSRSSSSEEESRPPPTTTEVASLASSTRQLQPSQQELREGDTVWITGGVHQGKRATFVKQTPQRVAVRFPRDTNPRYLMPHHVSGQQVVGGGEEEEEEERNDPILRAFRTALQRLSPRNGDDDDDSSSGGDTVSVATIRNTTSTKSQSTLLGVIFQQAEEEEEEGVVFVEVSYSPRAVQRFPKEFLLAVEEEGGETPNSHLPRKKYSLIATKVHQDTKTVTCAYLRTNNNNNNNSHGEVASRLLSLGAFDKLIPRKVAARLELLLSSALPVGGSGGRDLPTTMSSRHGETNQDNGGSVGSSGYHVYSTLRASDFSMIPEQGNVGCGFIPPHKLQELLSISNHRPSGDMNNASAIQVRIVIPTMGIFKGVLMVKPGISTIQLPPSMRKVEPSSAAATTTTTNFADSAFLMINQSGVFPYTSRIERSESGFVEERPFSEMAKWMLIQKGVSHSIVSRENRFHDTCKGVTDPMDAIPWDCIYLTGIQGHDFPDKVVISRYPMTEASDGRVVKIIKDKPLAMSDANWAFLSTLRFGLVIFGAPPPGRPALPETIAQGDLDGDDYFICWDQVIVADALLADPPMIAIKNNPNPSTSSAGQDPNARYEWWNRAMEFMTDIESRKRSQRLISALHTMWKKKLQEGRLQESHFFGRAFKQSIDVTKHGGKVALPQHLWTHIEYNLRRFLEPPSRAG